MAFNLLPLLLAGGGIKRGLDRHLEQKDRSALSQGVSQLFAPGEQGFNAPTFNADGSIGAGAQQGSGLFNGQTGADFRSNAASLFALPGGSQFGQSLIEQSLGFEQRNQEQLAGFSQRDKEQIASFGQQDAQQLNQFGQRDLEQENQQAFTTGQNALDQTNRNEQNNLDRLSREGIAERSLAARTATSGIGGLAEPNSQGYVPYIGEDGQIKVRAVEGSPAYNLAKDEIFAAEKAVTEIDAMLQSIQGGESQQFGAEAGRQKVRYENIFAHIAVLQNKGVIQKDEAERIEASLTNPTTIDGATTSDERIEASFKELQKLFQSDLKHTDGKYSSWGLGSQFSKQTPEQLRAMEEEAARRARAEQLGLSPDAPDTNRERGLSQSNHDELVGDAARQGLRGILPGGGALNLGLSLFDLMKQSQGVGGETGGGF